MKSHLGPYFTHPYITFISNPFSSNNGKYILHTTAQNTFHFLFYHSLLFTLLEPPIIGCLHDTGVDIHTDMPEFIPVLSMAVHHLCIDDTGKYHNGRSHTCNSGS